MSQRRIELTYNRKLAQDINSGKLTEAKIPTVPISISSDTRTTPYMFNALIDSGADHSLFPAEHAQIIGINVKSVTPRKVGGVGKGGPIIAYRHDIILNVIQKSFVTYADFTYDCDIAILGREGFFNLFKRIDFDQKNHKVILHT